MTDDGCKAFSKNFLKVTFYNTSFKFSLPSSKGNFRDNVDVLCTEQLVFPDKHLEVCRCQMHCF